MIDYIWLWSELLIRWVHVIAGIAWIGSSFYFIALDLSLKPGKELPEQAHGQAWQVHGGGFYNMVKYLVAPSKMPDELTWFKWEAYATWISGFALLTVIYYTAAGLYMIDLEILDIAEWQAVAISLAGIVLGWAIYDGLCRSPLGKSDTALATAGFVFLVALAWGYTQIFSARGAFVQMGVTIGTIMVANVLMIIIPGQRKVVKSLVAGEDPDPRYGARGRHLCIKKWLWENFGIHKENLEVLSCGVKHFYYRCITEQIVEWLKRQILHQRVNQHSVRAILTAIGHLDQAKL